MKVAIRRYGIWLCDLCMKDTNRTCQTPSCAMRFPLDPRFNHQVMAFLKDKVQGLWDNPKHVEIEETK